MNDTAGYGRFAGSGLQDVEDYRLSKPYSALYLNKLYEELYLNSTLENMSHVLCYCVVAVLKFLIRKVTLC